MGLKLEEKSLPLDDLRGSYFLTSTSTKIMPLNKIGETNLEISEELKALMKAFEAEW